MRQVSSSIQVRLASNAVAAGTTAVVGSTIDTLGYEDVTIVATLGTITSTGVPTLKAQGGAASDGTDKADIAGSAKAGNDTQSNKLMVLEIHRPKQRYITPVLLRATANVVVQSIHVLLSNPSQIPVPQPDFATELQLVSPNLGTA